MEIEEIKEEEEKKESNKNAVNHYKEMGLESSEKTNIIARISKQVGITIKGKKSVMSPKNKSQAKLKNLAKKKTTLMESTADLSTQFIGKQFIVESSMLEPHFRYVPDRGTIQRLITRAANMKDDLAELIGDGDE